ncbi:DUF6653 family protein [Roseobacter sp. HKCCA0434]|uniref:DUF6653 family protein n=1 Tax=Roseobacter sp. HKCCA0434 TaxID=3079297 RepID=UPI00290597FC|nr:DUF6653 family protein [Roseobacter sp. HKCCA0434]
MDLFRATERMMAMDAATWARHANPWSGWSRVPVLPLAALAIWSRVWIVWWALVPLALLVAWTLLNPRAFPPPRDLDTWMSRGVLGERLWLDRARRPVPAHHARAARLTTAIAAAGLVPLAWGLWSLDAGWTVAGLVLAVGGKLWFLDRMVWLHADMTAHPPGTPLPTTHPAALGETP